MSLALSDGNWRDTQAQPLQRQMANAFVIVVQLLANAFGKYQFVVDRMKVGSLALGVWSLSH